MYTLDLYTGNSNEISVCVIVNVVDGEVLHIVKISRLHMGAYLCIASNDVPPRVSQRISLRVQCEYTEIFLSYIPQIVEERRVCLLDCFICMLILNCPVKFCERVILTSSMRKPFPPFRTEAFQKLRSWKNIWSCLNIYTVYRSRFSRFRIYFWIENFSKLFVSNYSSFLIRNIVFLLLSCKIFSLDRSIEKREWNLYRDLYWNFFQ